MMKREKTQDSVFLDAVSDKVLTKRKQWKVILHLNWRKEEFKIDTGAEVTAVLNWSTQVTASIKVAEWPSRALIEVLGEFKGQLKHKHKGVVRPIFVVKDRRQASRTSSNHLIEASL